MSTTLKYGDILEPNRKTISWPSSYREIRVQFIRYAVGTERPDTNGQWFFGVIVNNDPEGMSSRRRIGEITMFPERAWTRADP